MQIEEANAQDKADAEAWLGYSRVGLKFCATDIHRYPEEIVRKTTAATCKICKAERPSKILHGSSMEAIAI